MTGAKLNPIDIESAESAIDPGKAKIEVYINRIHIIVEHCGEEGLRATANHYNWTLSGKFEICQECAIAKARQKNTNKE